MYLPQRLPGQEWLGVVIALPEPWVSVLTDIRVSLGDDQGTKVPAHITILPPTAVDMERREEVIEHLRAVAQRYTPFRVTLGDPYRHLYSGKTNGFADKLHKSLRHEAYRTPNKGCRVRGFV